MKLDNAYRIRNLDLVQFLNKIKYVQVNIFDQFLTDDILSQLLHYNACAYVLKRHGENFQLPPILKISDSLYKEMHVRITVAPYNNDLLVLLFPGNDSSMQMRKMLETELNLEPFSPTGKENDSPEFVAWRTVFDNMLYASPSNFMFSVVLSPVSYKVVGLQDVSIYMQDRIPSYCANLTVNDVLRCAELTFPAVRSNINLNTLEETLNAIKNEL